MALSISRTTELLSKASEPSTCSGWTCLTLGEKVNTVLKLRCLCGSYGASPSSYGYVSAGSSSSITTSTSLLMFMF